ncbi:hypothetical protein [Planomonospora venezuelensis]|uniref:Uncharacterized protein n=1 Tax=Planomonospora venezuelensis TaxID=1999 RepID=A0A841DDR2_PLAVE|nr:hypothetical protein [Planomonospora venezuelensis]MBB5966438.1 hypothetical protein [Planomonospora venezuelensis]
MDRGSDGSAGNVGRDESRLVAAVSNHPLREGEQEAITWMSCDRDDGVDYGRVAYARRPSGEPVFEDPEVFTVGVRPHEGIPGFALLGEHLMDETGN